MTKPKIASASLAFDNATSVVEEAKAGWENAVAKNPNAKMLPITIRRLNPLCIFRFVFDGSAGGDSKEVICSLIWFAKQWGLDVSWLGGAFGKTTDKNSISRPVWANKILLDVVAL